MGSGGEDKEEIVYDELRHLYRDLLKGGYRVTRVYINPRIKDCFIIETKPPGAPPHVRRKYLLVPACRRYYD